MSQYPATQRAVDRLSAGSLRTVSATMPSVREKLLPLVRQLGLTLTTEQFSVLIAERGSRFGGLTMSPKRVPLELRIDLDPRPDGTQVTARLEDRWSVPLARNWGAISVYAEVFTELLSAIDTVLARVDPAAAPAFGQWWRSFDDATANQSVAATAARAEQAVARRTSRVLDGPQSAQSRSAMDEAGLSTVAFVASDRAAQLQADDVDGVLTAGQLVAARPGTMPALLVRDVQDFVVLLERDLEQSEQPGPRSQPATARRLAVDDKAMPVLSFLYQQAKLRELLPMRLLMVCTTCRLEKVVNPDFARIRERARRTKVITGSVGAVFGSHHVSPYILVGKLLQLNKTDPDFVCGRCQGMDADQSMITFCQQCGDRRTETVLRTCPKCSFDFRTLLPKTTLWHELPPPASMAAPAPTMPGAAPALAAPVVVMGAPAPSVSVAPAAWSAPVSSAYGAPSSPPSSPPSSAPAPATGAATGWYPDPWQRHQLRYYDGARWTAWASTNGRTATDPIE